MTTEDSNRAGSDSSAAPLAGLKVLELSTVVMGPFAAQLLAEFGAEVVKLESPEGDSTRNIGPMRNAGMGAMFLNANRNKRSIVLDLKRVDGLAACLRLIERFDVLLANVRTPALERLGLSYEQLTSVNPRLIYVALDGYGDTGPYAAQPAYEDLIQGVTALPSLVAEVSDGQPHFIPVNICDRSTGLYAVNAILAALLERHRSGLGQRISLSMFECVSHFILGDHLAGRTFVPDRGSAGYERLLSRDRSPYATKDGFICVLLYTEKHWQAFLTLCPERAELERDERFRDVQSRRSHFRDLHRFMDRMLRERNTADWLSLFRQADIPATPVQRLDDLIDDPHHRSNGFFRIVEHGSEGRLRAMRMPGQWSRTGFMRAEDAPRLGQHTEEVLREAGYNQAEVEELLRSGAARGAP